MALLDSLRELWLVMLLSFLNPASAVTAPRNLLYIVVDDLTSNLKLFGGEITQMVTPNLERLARRSVNFHRAYAQQAVCGPSRNSFLTGLYPDQTHVYTFTSSFRDEHPEAVSLPELFKHRGFLTCGFGKTFHDDRILSPPDYDMPRSWSEECPHYAPPQDFCGPGRHGWCSKEGFGEDDYTDGLGTSAAIQRLRNRTDTDRPFFFVVGLRKPHMDWALPPSFFDRQVPQQDIELPPASRRVTPEGMPPIAWWNCSVEGPWKKSMAELALFPKQPLDDDVEREILRAYYAAVSYTDHQVGRLLDELEALGLSESTAIVFHSDHGFALSEEGMHCKRHTMEAGARVPLLVSVPWLMPEGRVEQSIVELVDVYPTIASIMGQAPEDQRGLHGVDLLPLLSSTSQQQDTWRRLGVAEEDLTHLPALAQGVAFSQYPRCRSRPDAPGGLHDEGYLWNRECCLNSNEDIDAMGFSVRVPGWRMTEWLKFDNQTWLPQWTRGGLLAVELYEQDREPEQLGTPLRNLADDQEKAPIRRILSRLLAGHFGSLLRPKPGLCLSDGQSSATTAVFT